MQIITTGASKQAQAAFDRQSQLTSSPALHGSAGHDVRRDQFDVRNNEPSDMAEPFGELASINIEAAAGTDLSQPIQWNMIAKFADHDVASRLVGKLAP